MEEEGDKETAALNQAGEELPGMRKPDIAPLLNLKLNQLLLNQVHLQLVILVKTFRW